MVSHFTAWFSTHRGTYGLLFSLPLSHEPFQFQPYFAVLPLRRRSRESFTVLLVPVVFQLFHEPCPSAGTGQKSRHSNQTFVLNDKLSPQGRAAETFLIKRPLIWKTFGNFGPYRYFTRRPSVLLLRRFYYSSFPLEFQRQFSDYFELIDASRCSIISRIFPVLAFWSACIFCLISGSCFPNYCHEEPINIHRATVV